MKVAILASLIWISSTYAQPVNDECNGAIVLPSTFSSPYTTKAIDPFGATGNPNDPILSCNPFDVDESSITDKNTVWFKWTPSESGKFDFTTFGSSFAISEYGEMGLGVFVGPTCDDLDVIGDIACGYVFLHGIAVEAGKTYFVKVGVKIDGIIGGSLILTVRKTPAPPPNDECIGAAIIPSFSSFPIITAIDPFDATANPNGPLLTCDPFYGAEPHIGVFPWETTYPSEGRSVWFKWTPSDSAKLDISILGSKDSFGEFLFGSAIGIYMGPSCDGLEYGTRDVGCGGSFVLGTSFEAGKTYIIKVSTDPKLDFGHNLVLTMSRPRPSPQNDECVNAAVLPPSSDMFLISSEVVDISSASKNLNDPNITCDFDPRSNGFSVWFKWAPSKTGFFDITILGSKDGYNRNLSATIGIFSGATCDSLDVKSEISCGRNFIPRTHFEAGSTYFFKVEGDRLPSYFGSSLVLSISQTPPSPPNDECINAAIIPSSSRMFPFTTKIVDPLVTTRNPSDPQLTCNAQSDIGTFEDRSLWFKWSPSESGQFDFSTIGSNNSDGGDLSTSIGIYRGSSCDELDVENEIACAGDSWRNRVRNVDIIAQETYFVKVGSYAEKYGGMLLLSVKPSEPTSNDKCSNATVVNIQPGQRIRLQGDTTNAFVDDAFDGFCNAEISAPGVWYKFTNTLRVPLSVTASTCNERTKFYAKVKIFKGDNCDLLDCVSGNYLSQYDDRIECRQDSEFSFVASASTTYWVFVHGYDETFGEFELTIDYKKSFFALIDSHTDKIISPLQDFVEYAVHQMTSVKLNIVANFNELTTVKSVRMTFDKPSRSFCKNNAPYSVFGGNSISNYYGEAIPLGTHVVNATPYSRPNCRGLAGTSLTQIFEVKGCIVFSFYDVSVLTSYDMPSYGHPIMNLPCKVNFRAFPDCTFPIREMKIELRNSTSSKVVVARVEKTDPYLLFGKNGDEMKYGFIRPGVYSLRAIVNGLVVDYKDIRVSPVCI